MKKNSVRILLMMVVTLLLSTILFNLPVLADSFEVEIGSVQGSPGEIVTVPISFRNVPAKGVNSCDFAINYDKGILKAIEGGVTAGAITKSASRTFDSITDEANGTIKFLYSDETGFGGDAITSDGVFANIKFMIIKGTALNSIKVKTTGETAFGDVDMEYIPAGFVEGRVEVIAKQGYKITGYIEPDLTFGQTSAALLKSGFTVKIAGTENVSQTDQNGFFEIYAIGNMSSCTLAIEKEGYLYREIKNINLNNPVGFTEVSKQSAPIMMWVGDMNKDNAINMADIMELCSAFNTSKDSVRYKSEYDVNKDDAVNMADIIAVVKHFNKVTDDYNFTTSSVFAVTEKTQITTDSFSADTVIDFKDANFEKIVREKIGKIQGSVLQGDVAGIVDINCSNAGIIDIEGIQYFESLEKLDLSRNKISYITPLCSLKNLKCLYLANNVIEDFSPVKLYYNDLEQKDFRQVYKMGDLNGDREIGSDDREMLKKFILGREKSFPLSSGFELLIADLNGDGKINSLDYTWFKKFLLSFIDTFPNKTVLPLADDTEFDFDPATGTILKYIGAGGDIRIPCVINGIPVKGIDNLAFQNCTGLTRIIIPEGVTYIGDYAFNNCSSLISAGVPKSVSIIGRYAFSGCSNLGGMIIPEGVSSIDDNTFYDCRNMTSIKIPSSVTSIGKNAFFNCSSLKAVAIPQRVNYVGENAFSGCNGLNSITVPQGVTNLGDGTFYNCSGLTYLKLPDGLTGIGKRAFQGCRGLTSVTIPQNVTAIEENTFSECTGLNSISIPAGVVRISDYAFSGCSSLNGVNLPEGITNIGYGAFFRCTRLTGIKIPKKLSTMGARVFEGCNQLLNAEFQGNQPTYFGDYVFEGAKTGFRIIVLPEAAGFGKPDPYRSETFWTWNINNRSSYTVVISGYEDITPTSTSTIANTPTPTSTPTSNPTTAPEEDFNFNAETGTIIKYIGPGGKIIIPGMIKGVNVTGIGDYAFSGCSGLYSLVIPESVTGIGNGAFSGCIGLNRITIPSGVNKIGNYAFQNCSSLLRVQIPTGVTGIGDYTFSGCGALISITIPQSITSIGNYAFSGCSSLTAITIPEGVRVIGDYTFQGCSGLTGLIVPERVTGIGEYAFSECSGLSRITIPTGVTRIGKGAFHNCSNLTGITIPQGVTCIEEATFQGCGRLIGITIPENVRTIRQYAFAGCIRLSDISIPASITAIEDFTFSDCSKLTGITLPVNLTSIGYGAFLRCTSLMDITIPAKVSTIKTRAFEGCTMLNNAVFLGNKPWEFGTDVFKETSADFKITVLPSASGFGKPGQNVTSWIWEVTVNTLYRVVISGT